MYLLKRFTKQRLAISKWRGEIGPRVAKFLENNKKDANQMTTYWTGKWNFQVKDGTNNLFRVDLFAKTCSCRKWDLSGIPCGHAISAIWYMHEDLVDHIAHWYKKATYEQTYDNQIELIHGQDQWPYSKKPQLGKPPYHKQPSRQKKLRRLEHDEVISHNGTKLKRCYTVLNAASVANRVTILERAIEGLKALR